MVRRQVQFDESQLAALQEEAARAHVSFAQVVRQAVDGYLAGRRGVQVTRRRRRILDAAGGFGSGRHDISEQHDDYLAEAFRA